MHVGSLRIKHHCSSILRKSTDHSLSNAIFVLCIRWRGFETDTASHKNSSEQRIVVFSLPVVTSKSFDRVAPTLNSCLETLERRNTGIRKKKSLFQWRPALDVLRALGKILDSNLALIGSWHAGNSQHIASPSKRCARRGIYYPRRIPYSFPLQGSPEVELSCPRSASIQTLRQAVHQLPAQNT